MNLTDFLLDLIYPPACAACHKIISNPNEKTEHICRSCKNQIVLLNELYCLKCGKRLPNLQTPPCHKESLRLFTITEYANPVVKNLIHSLKYKEHLPSLVPINNLFISAAAPSLFSIIPEKQSLIIVPIPLYKNKKRRRGFNQAELLAEKLSQKISTENRTVVVKNLLKRVKNTKTQAELTNHDNRLSNIKDCFTIQQAQNCGKESLFMLVDDVATSGATLNEAGKILRKNGFSNVIAFVLAKA